MGSRRIRKLISRNIKCGKCKQKDCVHKIWHVVRSCSCPSQFSTQSKKWPPQPSSSTVGHFSSLRNFSRNRSIKLDYNRGGKVQQDRSLLLLAVVENVNIYQHRKSNEIPHPQRRPPHAPIKEHIYSCWPEKWNMTRGKLESLIRRPFCMFKQPNQKPFPFYDYYCNRNIDESGGGKLNTAKMYPFSNSRTVQIDFGSL